MAASAFQSRKPTLETAAMLLIVLTVASRWKLLCHGVSLSIACIWLVAAADKVRTPQKELGSQPWKYSKESVLQGWSSIEQPTVDECSLQETRYSICNDVHVDPRRVTQATYNSTLAFQSNIGDFNARTHLSRIFILGRDVMNPIHRELPDLPACVVVQVWSVTCVDILDLLWSYLWIFVSPFFSQAAKTANSDVPGNDLLSEASRLLDEHVLENTED